MNLKSYKMLILLVFSHDIDHPESMIKQEKKVVNNNNMDSNIHGN